MLWKDGYKIGVKLIDEEHKGLYDSADKMILLLEMPDPDSHRKEYKAHFIMTKNSIIKHFKDEEKYLRAIKFPDYEQHKERHDTFMETLTGYEKRLNESKYSNEVMREFMGSLISWLVSHILECDRKIGKEPKDSEQAIARRKIISQKERERIIHESCQEAIRSTFRQMYEVRVAGFKRRTEGAKLNGNIFCSCEIETSQNENYEITIGFRNEFALKLFNRMTGMELQKVDELVISSMAELTDIISSRVDVLMCDSMGKCKISPVETTLESYTEPRRDLYQEVMYLEVVTGIGSYDTMVCH